MNILVYGANGWIGNQFVNLLKEKNISFVNGKSRADNYNDLIEEINQSKPSHVISFIGRTHGKIDDKVYTTIDYLEQEGKLVENVRDNLYSPLLLAKICSEMKIHYAYLGTGCIVKFIVPVTPFFIISITYGNISGKTVIEFGTEHTFS